jgi:molybdopterin converting factor small subunit
VRILFYGRLADAFGRDAEVDIDLPCTVGVTREQLQQIRPDEDLGYRRAKACVNGVLVEDDCVVHEGDSLEFLAPVSGG